MALIVQKYGGTSVADLEKIRNAARRIKASHDNGDQVVVVVSARAGVTNRLIRDAKSLQAEPDGREMDLLLTVGEQETMALTAMALHALGVSAVSRTGAQAGIFTDSAHTRARIRKISGGDLREQLDQGNVVIVAGFQGISEEGQVTTFGRNASDLTAVALASALNAETCQILTDVDGVFTADPRLIPEARKIEEISYDEMLELAGAGSKVVQSRAVEFAKNYGIELVVRSSFNNNPGTVVKEEVASMEDVAVRGVALEKDQAKVVLSNVPDIPGTAAKLFQVLAEDEINVDMIVQNIGRAGKANVTFTIAVEDTYRAERAVHRWIEEVGAKSKVSIIDQIAKVSVVGVGMRSHTGVAATMFTALAEAGVNIQLISTSEIKISVAIDLAKAEEACRVVHSAFQLAREAPSP